VEEEEEEEEEEFILVHLRNPPMSRIPTHSATFILMLRRTRVKTAVFTTRP